MMRKIFTLKRLVIVFTLVLSSCAILKTARFAQCEFSFKDVSQLSAKGISIKGKSGLSSLSFKEAAVLGSAVTQKNVPINLDVNVLVKNPNEKEASLNKIDYIVLLDKKQILDGTTNQRIKVKGNGQAVLPLSFTFELFKAMEGKSFSEIAEVLWDVASDSDNPDHLQIKIRPYFYIGNQQIKYPGYISVMKK